MRSASVTSRIGERLAQAWARLVERQGAQADAGAVAELAVTNAPVIWLLGKVQSGKSSIVEAITGCSHAEVGSGFRPCTRTSRAFDFPAEAPVIRFLDTRGLGEVGYVPEQDLGLAEANAHLLLVVMRAVDHQQNEVIEAVKAVRRRHPEWPIVVAQTCLHDAYRPGDEHIQPYPYAGASPSPGIPEPLARSLAHQQTFFARVGGSGPILFAPIDFTREEDGFDPRAYGMEALLAAISEAAPNAITATLRELEAASAERWAARANPIILGHAAASAAVDVMPLAGAVAVPGVQARLLYALAAQQGVPWDRRALVEFGGCLGAGILTRLVTGFGVRQLAKLVPVYGQTIGATAAAATSFATTYALGKAGLVFLARRKRGTPDAQAVATAYREALKTAFALARARGLDNRPGAASDAQR